MKELATKATAAAEVRRADFNSTGENDEMEGDRTLLLREEAKVCGLLCLRGGCM